MTTTMRYTFEVEHACIDIETEMGRDEERAVRIYILLENITAS